MTNTSTTTINSNSSSNSNSNSSGHSNSNGNGKSKARVNERNGSGNEDDRHHRHSPLSGRPGIPYTVEVHRESESTTPESTAVADHSTHQQIGVTAIRMDISNNSNVTHQTLDGMVQYHQQQDIYQLQSQLKQSQPQQHSMPASIFNNLSSSPTSTQQSFASGGTTTPGMEYGMGSLFTFGDGLTGDHTSSLLYDTFLTSDVHNQHIGSNQNTTMSTTATASTTTTPTTTTSAASILPMTTADAGLTYSDHMDISASGVLPVETDPLAVASSSSTSSSSSSLHFPYPSYMSSPHIVFSSSQSSPSTNHYIPHPYLPSR
ncbi:hypothetical protein BCR42DRAFT_414782 [Absidia repens]|uniref:Uncharacterized protein n=1 Tax=Absidia repens TaxID=90262 RepID=A0A1X2IGZ4_9FUNG|nr:hypothetical protein BCR42DRAFT_414782 [Absidia repens]